MQKYFLFSTFDDIISFFFNNFAPCKIRLQMNLTIDIGNTCTKLVAFDGLTPVEEMRMDDGELFKLTEFYNKYHFTRGIYSTVVQLSEEFQDRIKSLPFPMIRLISDITPVPINNKYLSPRSLGTDRLAAVVGAYYKKLGHDVLIIDVGTCITYDFITSKGDYLGGNISPGPTVRLKALNHFTDSLPLIDRKGNTPFLGNSTETAIRSGVMYGVEREIEGYIRDFLLKYPDLFVYLTGGVSLNLHISEKKRIFADKFIVPEGLNRILLYNYNEDFVLNEKNNISK